MKWTPGFIGVCRVLESLSIVQARTLDLRPQNPKSYKCKPQSLSASIGGDTANRIPRGVRRCPWPVLARFLFQALKLLIGFQYFCSLWQFLYWIKGLYAISGDVNRFRYVGLRKKGTFRDPCSTWDLTGILGVRMNKVLETPHGATAR